MSIAEEPRTGGGGHVGKPLRRKEDPKLIQGRASYVDDINLVGQLWMAFVRSPEAHAKIVSIDATAAEARDDVTAVYTGKDMEGIGALPMAWVPPGVEVQNPDHWALAKDEVNHVGDPVAVVIGADKYSVIDAAEEVLVEYEPLPVVVDPEQAIKDEILVHDSLGTNKTHEWSLGGGDVEAGLAEADVVIERRIVNHRTSGAAIEPRGVLSARRRSGSSPPRWAAASAPSCSSTPRSSSPCGWRASSSARSSGPRRARSRCRRPTTAATRSPTSGWAPSATAR